MQLKADDLLASTFRKAIKVKVFNVCCQIEILQNFGFDIVRVIFLDCIITVEVAELAERRHQIGMESL